LTEFNKIHDDDDDDDDDDVNDYKASTSGKNQGAYIIIIITGKLRGAWPC